MGTKQAKQQFPFRTLGLSIDFPFPPYGTQRAMMNKLTATLCNKEHSLIESPTGTGKTLVLLCSALAWQMKSKEINQPFISNKLRQKIKQNRLERLKSRECTCVNMKEKYDIDDCEKMKKYDCDDVIIIENLCPRCKAVETEEKYIQEMQSDDNESVKSDVVGKASNRIPRIYYGTRTHKQITQVVRELNKTIYCQDLKMCILSARERTCINEEVRDHSDRNERCQDLISNQSTNNKKKTDIPTCPYYSDGNQLKSIYEEINKEYTDSAWDIEQLNEFGKKYQACPYFGVRKLQEEADITLCPYNYLLDPTIRSNLDINIKDAIIIIDEAHNLEDICRDSASFIIDTKQIDSIIETITIASSHYVQGSPISDAYNFFRDKFSKLRYFLSKFQFDEKDKDPFDQSERKVLTKERMLSELQYMGLGSDNINEIKTNLKTLKGDEEDADEKSKKDEEPEAALSSHQLQFIRQLTIALDFMYSNETKSLIDFRAVVLKRLDREPAKTVRGRNSLHSSEQPTNNEIHVWQLSLLCMNPAVAFEKIHKSAWSVIVASGTLSPMESLRTELGCTFSQPFEGGHVIGQDRIFASIVSYGPNKVELNCSYNNSVKLNFQDEVGFVVRDVCKLVPKGVLCFFPSYDRMENFCQRWLAKGIIRQIEMHKGSIFKEQKNLSANDFEKILAKYNKRAKGRGALLMAVFRGKVSEGIDFADDAARAVITIGIPYPNVREVSVNLKKEYNDVVRKTSPEIMPGGDWYASQAFRALNQALGRCIRHKDDWGSIIMIDSRLRNTYSSKNLSKWLQNKLLGCTDYSEIKMGLESFVAERQAEVIHGDMVKPTFVKPETVIDPIPPEPDDTLSDIINLDD